tara:strand:- start:308 stop:2545 length:2238 start_codon:yes stop_codon:yes gene_type:complete
MLILKVLGNAPQQNDAEIRELARDFDDHIDKKHPACADGGVLPPPDAPCVYDDQEENFQSLKKSYHIDVPEDAAVTFTAERIRDGYKRSVSFTTTQGFKEKWVYRSHSSALYLTLARKFDIKGIETASNADGKDVVDNFPFTASDYMIVHTLLKDMSRVAVSPPDEVRPSHPSTPPCTPNTLNTLNTPNTLQGPYDALVVKQGAYKDYKLDDIKGQDPAVKCAKNVLRKFTDPAYVGKAAVPMDTLLYGPPGTGKSMMYKCLINELQEHVTFMVVDRFDTHDAGWFKGLFEYANTRLNPDGTPRRTYVIIDELERVVTKTAEVRNNTIKNAWQSLDSYKYMTLIATTNFRDKIPQAIATRFQDSIEFNARTTEMVAAILKDKCEKVTQNVFDMSDADYKQVAKGVEPILQDPYCPREIWETLIIKAAEFACSERINITLSHFKQALGTMTKKIQDNVDKIREWCRATFSSSSYGSETGLFLEDVYNYMPSEVKIALGFKPEVNRSVFTSFDNTSANHKDAVAKTVHYLGDAIEKNLTLQNSSSSKKYHLWRDTKKDGTTGKLINYEEKRSKEQVKKTGQYVIGVGFKPCWALDSEQARCIESVRRFGFTEDLLNSSTFFKIPHLNPMYPDTFTHMLRFAPEPTDIATNICHLLFENSKYFVANNAPYKLVSIQSVDDDEVRCTLTLGDVSGKAISSVCMPPYQCQVLFRTRLLEMGDDNAKKVLAAKKKNTVKVPRRLPNPRLTR